MRCKTTYAATHTATQMSIGRRMDTLAEYHRLILSLVARQCAIGRMDMERTRSDKWLTTTLCKLQESSGREALAWRRFSELCHQYDIEPCDSSDTVIKLRKKLEALCQAEHCTSNLRKRTWKRPWDAYYDLVHKLQTENHGPIGFVKEEVTVEPDWVLLAARTVSIDLLRAAQPSFRIALYQIYCQQREQVEKTLSYMADVLLETMQNQQLCKVMEAEPGIANVLADPRSAEPIQLVIAFHAASAVRAVENIAQIAVHIAAKNPAASRDWINIWAPGQAYARLADRLDIVLRRETRIIGRYPYRWH